MFIDTHCHLADPKLADTDAVVEEYLKAGVDTVMTMGCCAQTSEVGFEQSKKYPSVYFASGVHPSDSAGYNAQERDRIIKIATDKKCVAIGEIGLDYYWKPYDKETQTKVFIDQIEIANTLNLPICVHMRDATQDTLQILKEHKPICGGVLHCFAGSVETAKIVLDMGFYISFAGTVTFKNANKALEVGKFVPVDRCLTETDSPFLAPTPYRGTINSPKNVPIICDFLAKLKGIELTEFAKAVKTNALTLFPKLANS
jgi:TatD DNase family protein